MFLKSNLVYFKQELLDAVNIWRYWLYRSFIRIQNKHRKTSLSVFWEPLGVLFVTVVLSSVWFYVLHHSDFLEYFLYVFVGFSIWTLLSSLVHQAVNSLRYHVKSISSSPISIFAYVFEDISFSVLNFLLLLPFVLLVLLLSGKLSFAGLMVALFGLLLAIMSGIGLSMSFGVAALFFGDIKEVVYYTMRLAFFATPILWDVSRLGEKQEFIWINPFYSYLDIIRSGLLNVVPDEKSFYIAICITLLLLSLSFFMYLMLHRKIRYRVFVIRS